VLLLPRCTKCRSVNNSPSHCWCRKCLREDMRERRKRDPAKAKEIARRFRVRLYAEHRRYITELKNNPCMDCGGEFPPCAMHFDHRDPSKKKGAVAFMMRNTISRARLEAEVAKCDLVCANCHAIRTWITRRYKS
jgi:hypothetical protein